MSSHDSSPQRVCHTVFEIGYVERDDTGARLHVFEEHRDCLRNLDGFGHAEVLWWFSECDDEELRRTKTVDPPFEAPTLGVFASHAPTRPNPIALSTVAIRKVDLKKGVIEIGAIDAVDGSPLLDIKPYMPHYSRVESPTVPDWASQWPSWMPEDGVELDAPPQ
jgi:tRNA-Thr(GGU) m(6)t(6)A37 methyltransferase TsaA